MAERITIEALGARAEGIARVNGEAVYVPFTLPGEIALIEREGSRGRLIEVEEPSPDRVEPFCPYYGACGGCATQHIAEPAYAAWKRASLVAALERVGFHGSVEPLLDAHGAGRRRITLHARFDGGRMRAGYMAARSHALIEIAFCPIAESGLKQAPTAALALAERLATARKPLDLQITATENGLDIDIRGHGRPSERERQALIDTAGEQDLARLSIHGEILVERRQPLVTMGRAQVLPPPGGFLQATSAGEEALSALVIEACGEARRVADLFAGCGPFSFRLAEARQVHAVDGDGASIAALDKAARNTPGLRRITTEIRDLFRRPLLPPELDRFDAVVIDPPRAGAEAQAKQLALSKVPTVASASCDAGTFARDAATLLRAGYVLQRVMPVDQFKYSRHLEIVGLFRRETGKRRR